MIDKKQVCLIASINLTTEVTSKSAESFQARGSSPF